VNLLQLALEVYGPEVTSRLRSHEELARLINANIKGSPKLRAGQNCELMVAFFKDHLLKTYD